MGKHNADSPSSSSGDGIGSVPLDIGFSDPPEKPDLHLRETGFSFADVELVGVTHQDRDHAGAVRAVTVRTGVITLAHEDAVPYLEGERDRLKGGDYPFQTVDIELPDGVVFRTAAGPMRVVATPDMGTATASLGRFAEFDVTRTLCFYGGLIEHDAGQLQRIYESLSEKLVRW